MQCEDEKSYRFHRLDHPDRCFECRGNSTRFLIVRHSKSMMLVHLCPDCLVDCLSGYLLDNTRPWQGSK